MVKELKYNYYINKYSFYFFILSVDEKFRGRNNQKKSGAIQKAEWDGHKDRVVGPEQDIGRSSRCLWKTIANRQNRRKWRLQGHQGVQQGGENTFGRISTIVLSAANRSRYARLICVGLDVVEMDTERHPVEPCLNFTFGSFIINLYGLHFLCSFSL